MRRKKFKRSIAVVMAAALSISGIYVSPDLRAKADVYETVKDENSNGVKKSADKITVREVMFPYMHTGDESSAESDNEGDNNYGLWASTVKSYLQELENGNLQRVEAIDGKVVVEQYNQSYEIIENKQLDYELPIFGGYFYGKDYQFLVFGQENSEESDQKEIMRVIKYDKDWNRISSESVCGANTTVPFAFGSLRMEEENGKLFIHTCHQMYTSEDGLRHQANMTYIIEEDSMKINQSRYTVTWGWGYVSHSFNQFVIAEDGKLYRLDHGDAYPRSVTISKCDQSSITNCGYENVWDIQGSTGDNTTKVSVGGFEKAGNNLITAGNSCTQESWQAWEESKKRNIFITVTNADDIKSDDDYGDSFDEEYDIEPEITKKIWLTNYREDDIISVGTPYLVKANDNLLYVMWEEYNSKNGTTAIKIVGIDAQGNKVTDVAGIYGRLSDCKPFYDSDGTIQWYSTSKERENGYYYEDGEKYFYIDTPKKKETVFYKIDTGRLGEYNYTDAIDFSNVEVNLEKIQFTYNPDKECKPKAELTYNGAYLEEGKDYVVSYKNNRWIGTAEMTLIGMGIFSGKQTKTFEIIKETPSPTPSIIPTPVATEEPEQTPTATPIATKEPEQTPTETPVTTKKPVQTKAPATVATKKPVQTNAMGYKYSAIIKKYLDAYEYVKKKQYDKIDSSVNMEYASGFYNKSDIPVYRVLDLNGDGTKELFVGIKNGKSTVTIYDVYTFKNGKVIRLMKDIGYRAGNCSLRKDGIIADDWSGSAFSFGVIYHKLPKNKTKLTDVIELRYSVNSKTGKTTYKKIVNGKKKSISKAQAKKIEKKYSKKLSVTFYKLTGTAVNNVKKGKYTYSGQKKWKVTT